MPTPELSKLQAGLTPRLTRYIPHAPEPPQAAFLLLDCLEAFYGGAAGGGKSDALLMAALQYADLGNYDALLLRRTFPELSKPGAIMQRSHEWLRPFADDGVRWNEQRKIWSFPSGATLSFGYCRQESDVYQYQGAEYDFIGFDELTQFSSSQFTYLFSRLRRRADSQIPSRMRAASNPGGIGHGWVKKRYITDRDARAIFIPARLVDNPHLDRATYVASMDQLAPVLRQQLLEGDWGAFEGMAYSHFARDLHCVPRFEVPDSWQRFESMDHGVSNPTAWLAWAVDYDGNAVIFDSYYQPGLPSVHAPAIVERRAQGWEAQEDGYPVRHVAWGDPASLRESLPTTNQWGEPLTLQDEYLKHGLALSPANNRRRAGYVRLAEMLKPDPAHLFPRWHQRAGENGAPRLFIVGERCAELVDQLENAPLASEENDPERGEAVDRKWEGAHGHAHAACRYGALSQFGESPVPEVEESDARRAAGQKLRKRLHFGDDHEQDL